MKRQIFLQIVEIVSGICDVPPEIICSSIKTNEAVEARALVVWHAHQQGLNPNEVARYLNRKRTKSIYDYLANYRRYSEVSPFFRILSRKVSQKMNETFTQQ